ncbi:MAG: HD-GYP domain-containing protein [Gemmatimonadaceae bacterium]
MQKRLKTYVALVCVGAALAAAGAYYLEPTPQPSYAMAAIYLAAFGVVAELLSYRMPQGGDGSIALIPYLACAQIAPDWTAVAAIGLSQVLVQLFWRRPVVKGVFNTAQCVLSISLAILAYRAAGGTPIGAEASPWSSALANTPMVLVALSVFVLTNTSTVSAAIAISQGASFGTVWRENTLGTVVYTLFAGSLSYLLAGVQATWGPVGAGLLLVPLVGFRQFYKTTLQLQQTNRELLELMVKAIEARDPYTSGHSRRVADAATVIARGIGLTAPQVERVRIAALLHDIGKIDEIYAPILRKEGKLTEEEWAMMKTHPIKSAELVSTLSDLRDIVGPVRHHHEHWDGHGYPDGLAGEDIPLGARIITFADTMDALMTDRPYRRALGEAEVRAEFVKNCGTQFDPTICGHILSPAVWAQLFPASAEGAGARLRLVTPAKQRAVMA